MEINVIDAPCGYGKTEWAIQLMKKTDDIQRYIFVTPYLNEVERIQTNLPNFKSPIAEKGKKKIDDIKELLFNGESLVTTHALFRFFDKDMLEYIKEQEYILILDEVMNVIDSLQVGKDAIKILLEEKKIIINPETHLIQWIEGQEILDINNEFTKAQKLIQKKEVYEVSGTGLIWTLPTKYFKPFYKIYILTYMFDYQFQAYYYKSNGLMYDLKSVRPTEDTKNNQYPNIIYELVDYKDRLPYDKSKIKKLINIYEGKLNTIGKSKSYKNDTIPNDYTLSSSWFDKVPDSKIEQLGNSLHNYFTNITKSKKNDRLWTCKQHYGKNNKKNLVTAIGNTKRKYDYCHIPINARGTNNYIETFNFAYLYNLFMNPLEKHYFETINKVDVDEDLWALSELIQVLYRTRIRKEEPINCWIPSIRMRELLKWWLNNESI